MLPTLRHALRPLSRSLATATVNSASLASSSSSTVAQRQNIIPLSNVEAQWEKMSAEDKLVVHEQLEEVMKKDWTTLTIDEKKAAYYVSFGPHGPRTPASKPGENLKVFLSVLGLVGVAGLIQTVYSMSSPPPPRTRTKEWEEATNERAIEAKINPITGISSEGYKGKGFVVHDK